MNTDDILLLFFKSKHYPYRVVERALAYRCTLLITLINLNIFYNADSHIIFAVAIVPRNKQIYYEMEITVYLNHEAYTSRKSVYAARMVVSDSLEIDFTTLLRAMRLIYGSSCIVIFTCL